MENPYLEKVYDLAKELNTAKNIKVILDTVADYLPKVIDAKYCSLFVKNPSSEELELKAHNHQNIGADPFIHIGAEQESIMNLAISGNSSIMIRNIEEEIGFENKDKYNTKSFLSILVKHEEEIQGVLNLADKKSGGFTKDDMLLASIIGELLGALFVRIDLSNI